MSHPLPQACAASGSGNYCPRCRCLRETPILCAAAGGFHFSRFPSVWQVLTLQCPSLRRFHLLGTPLPSGPPGDLSWAVQTPVHGDRPCTHGLRRMPGSKHGRPLHGRRLPFLALAASPAPWPADGHPAAHAHGLCQPRPTPGDRNTDHITIAHAEALRPLHRGSGSRFRLALQRAGTGTGNSIN